MKTQEYIDAVEANTPEGYPNLVAGWPDEEHDITWEAYIDWAREELYNVCEGDDIGAFQTFDQYKQMERENNPDRDNLGFSVLECALCGALPGERHAMTAHPETPSELNYIALKVCGDCLQYVVNGELPHDLEG